MDQRLVDSLPYEPTGQRRYKVPGTPGLTLVIGTTKKSWRLQRDVKGKAVAVVLAHATLKEAKAWAAEQRVLMARGFDPQHKPEPARSSGPGAWTIRQLMETRLAYMRAHDYSAAAIYDFGSAVKYLGLVPNFMSTLVKDLTKTKCGAAHRAISLQGIRGPAPVQANKAMDYLSASWRYAQDKLDDHDTMPGNPTKGAERNPVGKVQASIDDLAAWRGVVAGLPNPIRRHMHMIGLLTGLRWTTLRCLEWSWIDGNRLTIPSSAMKSRRDFVVPLSAALKDELDGLKKAVDFMSPGSRYLFPSLAGHTATDDDRALISRGWPGKLRRKTYRTQAERLDIPRNVVRALMDHTAPGMDGSYLHDAAMFDDLLKWQEAISKRLIEMMKGK